jgi:hypothetical protein
MLKRCPNTSIETGDELKLADSGEHLRKEIAKIRRVRKNGSDSYGIGTIGSTTELRSYSFELGMASTDGNGFCLGLGFR